MLCPQASDEQATDETMDTVGEAEGGVVGEVEGAHNEQILNDFGLVYVQAVCEIAFIDEPLPEERSISPTSPLFSYTLLCPALQKFMQFGQERTGGVGEGCLVKIYAILLYSAGQLSEQRRGEGRRKGVRLLHKRNLFMQFRSVPFRSGFICMGQPTITTATTTIFVHCLYPLHIRKKGISTLCQ